MTLQTHVLFSYEEKTLVREALAQFRELPPERHWDGALALMQADEQSLSREMLEGMLSVIKDLYSLEQREAQGDAIEFLTKVLELLGRYKKYTEAALEELTQDLQPLELDPIPSSGMAP